MTFIIKNERNSMQQIAILLQSTLKLFLSETSAHNTIYHINNFIPAQNSYQEYYYFLNRVWYYCNIALVIPVMITCVNRIFNPQMEKKLFTDYFARGFLMFGSVFYLLESIVKWQIDGHQTICMKAMYIHHFAGIFVVACLYLNEYIPWFTCPLGFMHGVCIAFPDNDLAVAIYGLSLVLFQVGIYRKPYRDIKYYNYMRYFVNFIWVFAIMLYMGDCSVYMQLYSEKYSKIN